MQAVLEAPHPPSDWRFDPPPEVVQSRIFEAGGYLLVSGMFDAATLAALHTEAKASRPEGVRQFLSDSDGSEGRGGNPARAYTCGCGGDLHWALHSSAEMAGVLSGLCGATVTIAGSGNYAFYDQPGDFLALHRDVLECDVTVITALSNYLSSDARPAGELTLYPGFVREPLSTVRAAGRQYGTPIPLDRGQTIILLGGLVPHEVIATHPGQERIVAVNCYRIETASSPLPSA